MSEFEGGGEFHEGEMFFDPEVPDVNNNISNMIVGGGGMEVNEAITGPLADKLNEITETKNFGVEDGKLTVGEGADKKFFKDMTAEERSKTLLSKEAVKGLKETGNYDKYDKSQKKVLEAVERQGESIDKLVERIGEDESMEGENTLWEDFKKSDKKWVKGFVGKGGKDRVVFYIVGRNRKFAEGGVTCRARV